MIEKIDDLILTKRVVTYAIVGAGGFLGLGTHDVAIPAGKFLRDEDRIVLPDASEEALRSMSRFEYAQVSRGWTADEAIAFARLVEPLDIRWFEEPCHWYDDTAQMARVRSKTAIPINAGQSEITSHGVRRLIDAGAVDIINYDASEGGGVTDWRRAALCAAAGVMVAHHEESQIAPRQPMASQSNGA